jgi:hypothetical protein
MSIVPRWSIHRFAALKKSSITVATLLHSYTFSVGWVGLNGGVECECDRPRKCAVECD